ncbi:MAG: Uncharacterised protein [Flavobacteriales bacterium UBA4585]|nr:MAG: Uncharacterised protein [Flavobacteriales bacterium UBA4585]
MELVGMVYASNVVERITVATTIAKNILFTPSPRFFFIYASSRPQYLSFSL